MKKLGLFLGICFAVIGLLLAGCIGSGNLSSGLGAASDASKAASLSDEDVRQEAMTAIKDYDTKHTVAAPENPYAKRLARLTGIHLSDGDLPLNYSAYITDDINAFAMADGSIRVYSGLMDLMTDEELLFVIGHEIGHVKLGHRKEKLRLAYAASAAKKGASAKGGKTGAVADSVIGDFAEKLINSQFSQAEEREADSYGVEFLKKNGYKADAAVASLTKLADLSDGNYGILSTHPHPEKRIEHLKSVL